MAPANTTAAPVAVPVNEKKQEPLKNIPNTSNNQQATNTENVTVKNDKNEKNEKNEKVSEKNSTLPETGMGMYLIFCLLAIFISAIAMKKTKRV